MLRHSIYSLKIGTTDGGEEILASGSDIDGVKVAADKGNAKAQYNLGWMYEMGKGVSIDNQKAVSLYRLASIKGHPKAQERLDLIINKAAEAQINFALGIQFERGQGVPQDLREAIKRYRIAANLGHIKAQEKINLVLSI